MAHQILGYQHASIFVDGIDASITFYSKLGLKVLRRLHLEGNADIAAVGRDWGAAFELVQDLEDHEPYRNGTRFEHVGLEIDGNLQQLCELLTVDGFRVLRPPSPAPPDTPFTSLARVVDPNGITVELFSR